MSAKFKSSRKALRYHAGALSQEERRRLKLSQGYHGQIYPRMLIDDIHNGIMPYTFEAERFSFLVTPENSRVARIITQALKRADYPRSLAASTSEFVRTCAQEILTEGKATYEISYITLGDDATPSEFRLEHVDPRTLIHRKGRLFQYVPKEFRAEYNLAEHIELDKDAIVTFTAPAPHSNLPRVLEDLSRIRNSLPSFAVSELTKPKGPSQFEWRTHVETQEIAVAKTTRDLGWTARGLLGNSLTEYYYVHRQLLFEQFKAKLRACIIEQANKAIAIAGKRLGFSAELTIGGIPTEQTVATAQEQLRSGDLTFTELLKPFLLNQS